MMTRAQIVEPGAGPKFGESALMVDGWEPVGVGPASCFDSAPFPVECLEVAEPGRKWSSVGHHSTLF